MRITAKGEYGVRAVVNLACRQSGEPVSIRQIAKEEDVSPEFLEQIFFRLKKAGLIRSTRGPRGGFLLGKPAEEISLKAILDAIGEPLYPVPCTNHEIETCKRRSSCMMSPVWHDFYDVMRGHLEGIHLGDFVNGTRARGGGAAQG